MRIAVAVIAYAVLWLVAREVSRVFAVIDGISIWYLPAGVTFAFLLLFGWRFVPVIVAVRALGAMVSYPDHPLLWTAMPVVVAAGYGTAAWLLREQTGFDPRLRRARDVFAFAIASVVTVTIVTVAGTLILVGAGLRGGSDYAVGMFHWWIGDLAGILVVTPMLLLYGQPLAAWVAGTGTPALPGPEIPAPPGRPLAWQAFDAAALFGGLAVALFGVLVSGDFWFLLPFMPLLWLAFFDGPRATAVAVFLVAICASLMVRLAGGETDIRELQFFLMSMSLASLTLAVVAEAWRASQAALERNKADLQQQVAEQTRDLTETNARLIDHLAAREEIEATLREISEVNRRQRMELETLYDGAPIGLAMFSRDLRFVRINERLAEFNGLPAYEHIGRTVRDIVPTVATQAEPLLRRVIESGEAITGIEIKGETPRAPGVERTWLEAYYPVIMADGCVEGVAVVVEDITERKRHEAHLKLAMRELNHRVRNTLTVVMSIAAQTARYSGSLESFTPAFSRRLRSLAEAHALLSKSNWQTTSMHDLAVTAISPFCDPAGPNVHLEGGDVALLPSAALAMSMIFHELAANAAKYGAYSVTPLGRLDLSWQVGNGDGNTGGWLHVRWQESGGPAVTVPARRGFGTRLIRHTIAHEFGGEVSFDYRPEGLVCELHMQYGQAARSPALAEDAGADAVTASPAAAP